jgi:hypothetical protein
MASLHKQYDLKLNEKMYAQDGTEILKVHGGWIYTICRLDYGAMCSVFVPYKEGE